MSLTGRTRGPLRLRVETMFTREHILAAYAEGPEAVIRLFDAMVAAHIGDRKREGFRSTTKLYRTWYHMRQRCEVPSTKQYADYGGRGIKVCAAWQEFEPFARDMGEPPTPAHSIDRIDVNGNYEPGNYRWTLRAVQAMNKRTSIFIECRGRRQTVTQWAREVGMKPATLRVRIRAGWPAEEAIFAPLGCRPPKPSYQAPLALLTYEGKTMPVRDWAKEYHLNQELLLERLRKGWTAERALTTPLGKQGPGRRSPFT